MPSLMEQVQALVAAGRVEPTGHGNIRMRQRTLPEADLTYGIADAIVVEEYPPDDIGPSVLLLQYDEAGQPLHVVWGIKRDRTDMAWVVTAYRPDDRWESDLMTRRRR